MKLRRQAAMGASEARTQGALVAALRVRPRTKRRTVQCGLGGRGFILNRVLRPLVERLMLAGAVLAIVPAHNEAGRIGPVVRAVAAQGLPLLVVDDGSSDGTGAEAAAAGAQVLRLEPNRGKGAALKAGFREALTPPAVSLSGAAGPKASAAAWAAFLTLDGDGQHEPDEIPRLLDAWQQTGADLVVGTRDYRDMPPIRWFTNSVSRLLFSRALGQRIPDNQSGFRVHSRRIAEAALSSDEQGFAFEVEEIAICVGRGYRLAWVPIKTIYGTETSDIKPWTHFSSFVRVARRARGRMKEERRRVRLARRVR